ncbi:MAG: 50S ribosomal protein L11 methyltransferase [Prevotellaceae bacterium]|jgi:ribosomal protein L11 methyltransferase|nr:50S ribosomal protein L11 methyltransferase [Prevotellaceae bacterium]
MDYIEISVAIEPYNEVLAEILIAELSEVGCDSFSDTNSGFNAYVQQALYDKEAIDNVLQDTKYTETIHYTVTAIKTENWNALWESNLEPVIIGSRCTIRAPFHTNLAKTELDVVIEPKMAFGTGHHETTYLMSEALLDRNVTGLQVLDMGCGTSILAIIAALKGAEHVDAIDNDKWATNNALDNVDTNGLSSKITVITEDALLLGVSKYKLILANINRNTLLNDMAQYAKSLVPCGSLIMSGIYAKDIPIIEKEANYLGLVKLSEKNTQ